MENNEDILNALRKEIDRIDDNIHDLIMQRTEIVVEVSKAKGLDMGGDRAASATAWRPSREMKILRRLISRHKGKFPKKSLVRVWREMFGALISMQSWFVMAVYMPERGAGYLEIARDQYGAYSQFIVCSSASQVIREVSEGKATVGIIPIEDGNAENAPWWIKLVSAQTQMPKVVARLPLIGPGEGRGDGREAYVVAMMPQDKTGDDRSLIVLEVEGEVLSISALKSVFEKAQIPLGKICGVYSISENHHTCLAEIDDYIDEKDPRLEMLVELESKRFSRFSVIGGYSLQITI